MAAILSELFGDEDEDEDESSTCIINYASSIMIQDLQQRIVEVREILPSSGCLGVFSLIDIPPGVLVMAEVPSLTFSDFDFENIHIVSRTIIEICCDEKAHLVSKDLFPRSLASDVSMEELERTQMYLIEITSAILDEIKSIRQDDLIDEAEMFRVFLVLQHNGFESGLYQNLTKVNHSCDPNCIKFSPSKSFAASEIWTTKFVKAGHELSICYVDPAEQTSKALQDFLHVHHRFICTCTRCAIHSSRALDKHAILFQQEEDLQQQLQTMETELQWLRVDESKDAIATLYNMLKAIDLLISRYSRPESRLSYTSEAVERMSRILDDENLNSMESKNLSDIESTAVPEASVVYYASNCEIDERDIHTSSSTTNNRECNLAISVQLQARAHKLGANAGAQLLQAVDDYSTTRLSSGRVADGTMVVKKKPKKSVIQRAAMAFLRHSLQLRERQLEYLGPHHPDLARTNLDVVEGISCVMRLLTLDEIQSILPPTEYPLTATRGTLLAAQVRYRQEGNALKELYSTRNRFPKAVQCLGERGSSFWAEEIPPFPILRPAETFSSSSTSVDK